METRPVVVILFLCAILTMTTVLNASGAPSELAFDNISSGPYLDKVLYKIISNDYDRVQALLDNQIDILSGPIDSAYLSTLNASSDIELSPIVRNGYGKFIINCDKFPLNISSLRRAFALALDKERISEEVLGGESIVHDSLIPYPNPFCAEDQLPYDYYENYTVQGNQLLNDAGFADISGDYHREAPDGTSFNIIIEYPQSSSLAGQISALAVEALEALNVDASAQATDFNEFLSRLYYHGDFSVGFTSRNLFDYGLDWLESAYGSEYFGQSYYNLPNWVNTTFDAWVDILMHSTDYPTIMDAAIEIQKIIFEDCPEIVAYENIYYSAYRTDRFEGQVIDVSKNVENEWTNLNAHLKLPDGGPFSGTLRVSMDFDPDSFNPMSSTSAYSKVVFDNLFGTLVKTGPDGVMRPFLSESYLIETHADNSAVPDGHTRLTFDIIQNASWSDGSALTSDDIAYTFNYYRDGAAYGNPHGIGLENLTASYAPSPSSVILEFETESYWHLNKISRSLILPRSILQSIGLSGWNTWNPVYDADPFLVSGPFNLTSVSSGNYVELSHNPLYHHRVRGTGSDLPVVSGPDDMLVVNGSRRSSISWSITDDNPLVNRVYRNGSLIEVEYYDTSTFQLDIDSYLMDYGHYNFTFQIQDWEYQSAVDTVIVDFVQDTFDPFVEGLADFIIGDATSSGTLITWAASDHNPANYSILRDNVEVAGGAWTDEMLSISHDIGALSAGEYNFTIILTDIYGYSSTDTVIVTVISDVIPPEVNHPDDMVMTLGETGKSITWNATDDYPYTFTLYVDDVFVVSDTWVSGSPIEFSLDGLEVGVYNYTIQFSDLGGNVVSDSVTVTVNASGLSNTEMMLLVIGGVAAIVIIAGVAIKVRR